MARGKLSPHFYGRYQIVQEINKVAFCLCLSSGARLHDVFHVGLLKKFMGTPSMVLPMLPPTHRGAKMPTPEHATHTCLSYGIRQVLVHWQGEPVASAT